MINCSIAPTRQWELLITANVTFVALDKWYVTLQIGVVRFGLEYTTISKDMADRISLGIVRS